MNEEQPDFLRAMSALGGDSPTAIAKALGGVITRQVVEYWQSTGRVPAKSAPLVERACIERGCLVSVEKLSPGEPWVRVKDRKWPHPAGRPLLDVAVPAKVAA